MALQWRNPKWTRNNCIDVEIEHRDFGWIPYTAAADDAHDILRREGGPLPLFAVITNSGQPIARSDPPGVEPVPPAVPKVALVRAMRRLTHSGSPTTSQGTAAAWGAVRAAIAAAGEDEREDWEMMAMVRRDDPALGAFTKDLPPATVDAAFRLAQEIDRGQVAG